MSRLRFWPYAVLVSISVIGCMPCPGGIVVGPSSSNVAMEDTKACSQVSDGARDFAPHPGSATAWELSAFGKCLRERGYLSIPESVLLGADSGRSDGSPCVACDQAQVITSPKN